MHETNKKRERETRKHREMERREREKRKSKWWFGTKAILKVGERMKYYS